MPDLAEWIPTLIYVGVAVAVFVGRAVPLETWRATALLVILLGLGLIDRAAYRFAPARGGGWRALAWLAGRAALIEVAVQIEGFDVSAFLYLLVPYRAALEFGPNVGYAIGAITWSLFAARLLAVDSLATSVQGLMIFALGILFVLVPSQMVLRERAARIRAEAVLADLRGAHAELEQAHAQHATLTAQAAELTIITERNQLARDIHDGLGHYLTAIAIQLEKALILRGRDAANADQAVQAAKDLADGALEDVRRSVGLLRGAQTEFQLKRTLQTLTDSVRQTGLDVGFHITGDEHLASLSTRMALFRIAQETLTNTQRHAHATRVDVTLIFDSAATTLIVRDNGTGLVMPAEGPTAWSNRDRHGLRGIVERAQLAGGQATLSSTPQTGTTVTVVVPAGAG